MNEKLLFSINSNNKGNPLSGNSKKANRSQMIGCPQTTILQNGVKHAKVSLRLQNHKHASNG